MELDMGAQAEPEPEPGVHQKRTQERGECIRDALGRSGDPQSSARRTLCPQAPRRSNVLGARGSLDERGIAAYSSSAGALDWVKEGQKGEGSVRYVRRGCPDELDGLFAGFHSHSHSHSRCSKLLRLRTSRGSSPRYLDLSLCVSPAQRERQLEVDSASGGEPSSSRQPAVNRLAQSESVHTPDVSTAVHLVTTTAQRGIPLAIPPHLPALVPLPSRYVYIRALGSTPHRHEQSQEDEEPAVRRSKSLHRRMSRGVLRVVSASHLHSPLLSIRSTATPARSRRRPACRKAQSAHFISTILAASPHRNHHTRHCLAPLNGGGSDSRDTSAVAPPPRRPTCRTLRQLFSLSLRSRALICPPLRISNPWRTSDLDGPRTRGSLASRRHVIGGSQSRSRSSGRSSNSGSGTPYRLWDSLRAPPSPLPPRPALLVPSPFLPPPSLFLRSALCFPSCSMSMSTCVDTQFSDRTRRYIKKAHKKQEQLSKKSHSCATSFPRRYHHLLPSAFLLNFPPLVVSLSASTWSAACDAAHGAGLLRSLDHAKFVGSGSSGGGLPSHISPQSRVLTAAAAAAAGMPGLCLHPRPAPRPARSQTPWRTGTSKRTYTHKQRGTNKPQCSTTLLRLVLLASRIERTGGPWKLRVGHRIPILVTISQTEDDSIHPKNKSTTSTLAPPRLDFLLRPCPHASVPAPSSPCSQSSATREGGGRGMPTLPPARRCCHIHIYASKRTHKQRSSTRGVLWGIAKHVERAVLFREWDDVFACPRSCSSRPRFPPHRLRPRPSPLISADTWFPAPPLSASGGAAGVRYTAMDVADSFGAFAHAYPSAYVGAKGREEDLDGPPGGFGAASIFSEGFDAPPSHSSFRFA
ncbi:hypothetical protein C8R45DRAFT_1124975 [Mycena sanguinolenta]|nr:hypothetical protein C8R45DRAFT_1124975 [Mycena sanguinolenta]